MLRMLARLRALLGFALLAGLLAFPAAAWNAHLLSSPVAVDAHHHHDGQADGADVRGDAHDAGDSATEDAEPHGDGDGGHTHLPSASAGMEAQLPSTFVAPMHVVGSDMFAPHSDVTRRGQATLPQKRPPRLG